MKQFLITYKSILITLLFLSGTAFSTEDRVEKAIFDSCDATAKILLKCMISKSCNSEADKLKKALASNNSLQEREKQILISDCYKECQKGKLLKTKEELQRAVNGEYNAIMNTCINSMHRMLESSEESN